MNQKLQYLAILTTILTISVRADNPPLHGKPIALESAKATPNTNHPPSLPVAKSSANVTPPSSPAPVVKTPIYIVPRVKWVQTPQGIFPLIPEKNWPDLIFLFPSADQTNLTFYSTQQ